MWISKKDYSNLKCHLYDLEKKILEERWRHDRLLNHLGLKEVTHPQHTTLEKKDARI